MSKRTLLSIPVLSLAFVALPLAAQAPAAASGNEMTISGQVVDLNCYVAKGANGEGHKMCAQACAKAGVALAILGSDGILYMPVSSKPADPQNARLQQHAEAKVKVTGMHRVKDGLHTIEIKTVEATTT